MLSKYSLILIAPFVFSSTVMAQDTSTNFLPDLVAAIKIGSTECQNTCIPSRTGIETCLNSEDTSDFGLAKCSCTSDFLKSISNCGICLDALNGDPGGYKSYTGYFYQCNSVGLQDMSNLISPVSSASTTSLTVDSAQASDITSTSSSTSTTSSTSLSDSPSSSAFSFSITVASSNNKYTSSTAASSTTSTLILPTSTLISSAQSLGVKFTGIVLSGVIISFIM